MSEIGLRTLPLAVLVDAAWESTWPRVRTIWMPLAVALAPAALVLQVLLSLWNLSMFDTTPGDVSRACGALLVGAAVGGAVFVYFFFVYGAQMVAAARALQGRREGLWPSVRFYLRPAVWGTDLLAWVLIVIGLFLCVAPGLLFLAAWSLRLPVMVFEGRFGVDALGRSWQLLTHYPGGAVGRHPLLKAFVVIVLGTVLGYAVAFVIQSPAVILNQVLLMRELAAGEVADPQAVVRSTLWLAIPTGVIAALAQLAVTLYMDFVVAHLYLDQRRRREGWDLEHALDALAVEAGGGAVADSGVVT